MRYSETIVRIVSAATVAAGIMLLPAGPARAHCDTMSGPVIADARIALDKGDVAPVLKWVKPDSEAEVRAAFGKAQAVRSKGPDARELADQYFLETLVRVHRAGEGAPYTGIKTESPDPMMTMADKALADGSADAMIAAMSQHLSAGVKERFQKALDSSRKKDESAGMGRQYVSDYVTYVHYVEGLHKAVMAAGHHHGGGMGKGPDGCNCADCPMHEQMRTRMRGQMPPGAAPGHDPESEQAR